MRRSALLGVLVLACLLGARPAGTAAPADERPSLAILGIKALGISKDTQRILVRNLNAEIEKLGKYRVVPYQEYRANLEMTNDRVIAVCGIKVDCYVNAGRMMGVQKLVVGVISGLGKSRTINLKLVDIPDGVLENDVSQAVIGKPEDLIPAIARLAKTLIEFVNELKIVVENVKDAAVAIDGREVGKGSEVVVKNERVGKHSLQVTREGYKAHTQFFSITYGDRKTLTVALQPTHAFVNIEANVPDAKLFLDGKELGVSPVSEALVKPGRHVIKATHRYYAPAESRFQARRGGRKDINLKLKRLKGSLQVTSEPDQAAVTASGKTLGSTPLSLEVEAGRYTLGLARDGFKPQEREIEVLPDGVNRFEFKLEARAKPPEPKVAAGGGKTGGGEETIVAQGDLPDRIVKPPTDPGQGPADEKPLYKKWWVWVAAGAGLAVIATAIAVPLAVIDTGGGSNLPSHDTRVPLP